MTDNTSSNSFAVCCSSIYSQFLRFYSSDMCIPLIIVLIFIGLLVKNRAMFRLKRTLRSIELNINTLPTRNVKVDYDVFYRYNQIYRPFVVKGTDDLCGYLDERKPAPLLNAIIPVMKLVNSSLYSTKCPIDYFIMEHFWGNVDLMHLPPVVPSGKYKIEIAVHSTHFAVNLSVLVEIRASNGAAILEMG